MGSNRFLMAAVVGGIVVFAVGGLMYGVLLMSFFEANQGSATGAMKDVPDYLHLFLGQLVFGVLLAVVMDKWARVGGVANGVKIGAALGLLIGFGYDLTLFAVTNMANITATLVDPLVFALQLACGGAAVGAILGERK